MRFVIEISGSAPDCIIKPTAGRDITTRIGGSTCVDIKLVLAGGFDGFCRLDVNCNYNNILMASGMETSVQIEKPYPWTKHTVKSNVPIQEYCTRGYFESAVHLIKAWFKGRLL